MKNLKLLPIMIATICLAACHKAGTGLTGKFPEVKVITYSQDKSTGAVTRDTTIGNFSKFDYAIFSGDTCTISNSLPPNGQLIQKYTYSRTVKGYALTQFYVNSGSVDLLPTMDTVINITANSFVVHSVAVPANTPNNMTYIFDAYYSK
ncbi:MAG TPA: hypothetical protein VG367_08220 [Mucilaginibacter sp.]|nr:hypothetical protein [Mucilaginibacter sp.]